jgi:tetratricopeptide (TPR) repeat protein
MVSDTELRFTLDDRRVYMTGFSGGARVAVAAAAAMKGKVAGVIGCGAGFHSEIPLSAAKSFAFFGAIGTVDFNFPELRALDDDLEKLGVEHRLEVFQGGHEWPPEDVCTHAIEWLELQAMKSGLRKPDPTFIDAQYSSAEERARRYRDKQDLYEAFLAYSSLARDFAGLKDTGTDKINSLELQKSKDVIKAMKREKATIENQKRLENEIFALLDGAMEGGERAFRRQDLIREFINLREQADQTGNETEHLTAARVLSLFWMRLNEDAASDLQNKNLGNAALRLELMARIRPENAQVHYRLSRIYALSGHKKDALGALRTAVAKGFNDAAEMETNPDFETLRMNPDFIRILDSLKK